MNGKLRKSFIIRIATGFVLAGVLLWLYITFDISRYANIHEMRRLIDSSGRYGPLLFIGLCILGIFFHLPGMILIAAGGLLFGAVRGFIYGWVGAMLGITGTFLSVRYVLRDFFQRSVEKRFHRLQVMDERLAQNGFPAVLLMRLIFFLAPPLNWTIGLTRVRFHHYLAGTALGIVPGAAIACYFADSIARLKPGDALYTWEMIVPAGLAAAVLIIAGFFARRFFRPPRSRGVEKFDPTR